MYVEPILAWRVWRLRDDAPVLESVVYGDPWPARSAFAAGCPEHARPARECECGVHALKTREQALELARWAAGAVPQRIVVGRVSLWGRVIPHELGYRAERAYPYDLELLDGDGAPEEAAARLRAAYLVDVLASAA